MSDEDLVLFADEEGAPATDGVTPAKVWKIAIIDDDQAVHDGTRFALYDYALNGEGIEIVSAFSAEEGRKLLAQHPDVAVVLLDVVMETETAGLDLVEYIRKDLGNEMVRIILRTGQPGQAPERRVIVDHDINDYKAKTELTADKLFTALTAAIRSYQQLLRMEETRRGLEIIIDAAARLFDLHSMQRLAEGVLTQIGSLLKVDCAGMLVLREALEGAQPDGFSVIAGSGVYAPIVGEGGATRLSLEVRGLVEKAFQTRSHQFLDRNSALYIRTASGREVAVVLEAVKRLTDTDKTLVEVFCGKLSIAFENVLLYSRLQEANATLERRVVERTRELTEANARLDAQRETLKRANAFKIDLLGMVAHDLKNPISVILGRAEIIGELIDRPEPPKDMLAAQVGRIVEPARTMLRMIQQLIEDAMSDALDITLRPVRLDVVDVVRRVVESQTPMAEAKDQAITIDALATATAEADPDRLREAVENIVSNAVKYSPRGGRISVSVATEPAAATPAGGRIVIRVADQGSGLTAEDLSRVFGRFQRLSATPTGGESSTGLGLSIAKQIVELHGGSVSAASAGPGQGSTFEIALPGV